MSLQLTQAPYVINSSVISQEFRALPTAEWRGVRLSLSSAFGLQMPLLSSISTHSTEWAWAAKCNAVCPLLFLTSAFAPLCNSNEIHSLQPPSAARWRAVVLVSGRVKFGSQPLFSRIFIQCKYPISAATCSGEIPWDSSGFISAPSASSSCTHSMAFAFTAEWSGVP